MEVARISCRSIAIRHLSEGMMTRAIHSSRRGWWFWRFLGHGLNWRDEKQGLPLNLRDVSTAYECLFDALNSPCLRRIFSEYIRSERDTRTRFSYGSSDDVIRRRRYCARSSELSVILHGSPGRCIWPHKPHILQSLLTGVSNVGSASFSPSELVPDSEPSSDALKSSSETGFCLPFPFLPGSSSSTPYDLQSH